jgi:hypothetical protein
VTRIFGNTDTDNRSTSTDVPRRPDARLRLERDDVHRATASAAARCRSRRRRPEDRAAGDSEDFFYVNHSQTMNVDAGHTLTLDGQDATDT